MINVCNNTLIILINIPLKSQCETILAVLFEAKFPMQENTMRHMWNQLHSGNWPTDSKFSFLLSK